MAESKKATSKKTSSSTSKKQPAKSKKTLQKSTKTKPSKQKPAKATKTNSLKKTQTTDKAKTTKKPKRINQKKDESQTKPDAKRIKSATQSKPASSLFPLLALVLVIATVAVLAYISFFYDKDTDDRDSINIPSLNRLSDAADREVTVLEDCDLAISYFKDKYELSLTQRFPAETGIYTSAFEEIFPDSEVNLTELAFVDNQDETKILFAACFFGDREGPIPPDNVDLMIEPVSDQIDGEIVKLLDVSLDNLDFVNEATKNEIDENSVRVVSLNQEGQPEVKNVFWVHDNKVILIGSNIDDEFVIQVDSFGESEPTNDIYKEIREKEGELEREAEDMGLFEKSDWKVEINFGEFGSARLDLDTGVAPDTVRNFVRLAYRGYYDNTLIHRMVERDGFAIIQGGDKERADGTGGRSASYISEFNPRTIPDEIWLNGIKPVFDMTNGALLNEPELGYPDYYKDFDKDNLRVIYPKGSIAMAKSSTIAGTTQPNSATSQFFLILNDTTLPAEYTIFGKVKEEDMVVLDQILGEVDPVDAEGNIAPDGQPNKTIEIKEIKVL